MNGTAVCDTTATSSCEMDLSEALQSEIQYLRNKVKELESQNAKLSALLSNCHCQQVIALFYSSTCTKGNGASSTLESRGLAEEVGRLNLGCKEVNMRKTKEINSGHCTTAMLDLPKRYVALKIMYFGQRFYGFASEAQMDPTVESEVFKALDKTRLIFGNKKELQYSRCGRTDKGVSSVGQVIALYLRSNLKQFKGNNGCCGENVGEIDYVRVLNKVLPVDIRVLGWSPVPIDFSARFSCLSRVYKYFFWRGNLDVMAMETASQKFVGEHDFRNFCKMDAANVHNYRRHILSFEMFPCNESFESDQLWVMKIRGSAFLWHQIRCMVAVLFLIGQGFESPNVIDLLLDIQRMPRKPQYIMAPEIPLVLQCCEFEGVRFFCSSDAKQALHEHLVRECLSYKVQATIFHEALLSFSSTEYDNNAMKTRTRRKEASYVPLMSRPTEPSYEERRTKLDARIQTRE
nr:tRNA pseudouridine(38/39) synthase isoform X1 [Ipomoea batatas]